MGCQCGHKKDNHTKEARRRKDGSTYEVEICLYCECTQYIEALNVKTGDKEFAHPSKSFPSKLKMYYYLKFITFQFNGVSAIVVALNKTQAADLLNECLDANDINLNVTPEDMEEIDILKESAIILHGE